MIPSPFKRPGWTWAFGHCCLSEPQRTRLLNQKIPRKAHVASLPVIKPAMGYCPKVDTWIYCNIYTHNIYIYMYIYIHIIYIYICIYIYVYIYVYIYIYWNMQWKLDSWVRWIGHSMGQVAGYSHKRVSFTAFAWQKFYPHPYSTIRLQHVIRLTLII